jgi:four helix bundle protein
VNSIRKGDEIMNIEDLEVFKISHEITLKIYEVTKRFPNEEKYNLISQMRRSASSIPMNLMEGSHRLNRKEYRQFSGIARGSVGELKYQLLLAKDLKYIDENTYKLLRERTEIVSKMLTGLVKSLKSDTVTRH